MTHAEFETLTGKKVAADFYRSIVEPAYMESTFNDKQEFAAAWNNTGNAAIIRNLTERIKAQNIIIEKQRFDKEDLGYFLADNAHLGKEHRERAIAILGEREYIKHQIKSGHGLLEIDKDLLIDLIG